MYMYFLRACVGFATITAAFASEITSESRPLPPNDVVRTTAEALINEVSDWLASNFDLPSVTERPEVKFVSAAKLEELRNQYSTRPQVEAGGKASDVTSNGNPRGTVALYDNSNRTIFLSDRWIGTSPADQSILVHEMVHHVQNLANLTFECPLAREKLAYKAQNRWLGRFGKDLESEFGLDPFSVLMNSVCM